MRNTMLAVVAAMAVTAVLVATADAAKTGPGVATGSAAVFVPNPVQSLGDESLTDQKDADAAVPGAAYHDVDADQPRRQRIPARRLGERRQRDRQPGVLADEHVPLHAPPGRVRAGDGLLLDHRGAEVHPEPRLRRRSPARSTTSRRTSASTSGASTTRSRPTIRRTSCASARAASTTPRTPR